MESKKAKRKSGKFAGKVSGDRSVSRQASGFDLPASSLNPNSRLTKMHASPLPSDRRPAMSERKTNRKNKSSKTLPRDFVAAGVGNIAEMMHGKEVELQWPKKVSKSGKLRIVTIGDTGGYELQSIQDHLPPGDVLIHTGNFTLATDWEGLARGKIPKSLKRFNAWLGKLDYKYKIVVSGDQELGLQAIRRQDVVDRVFTNATYLEDSAIEIENIKFYGCPWNSARGGFHCGRSALASKWKLIPDDIDVMITHIPPLSMLDLKKTSSSRRQECVVCGKAHREGSTHLGSSSLMYRVQQVRPKVHVFSHIQRAAGNERDRGITYINTSFSPALPVLYVDFAHKYAKASR